MSSKSFIRVKRSEWDFIKATQKEQKYEDRTHANYVGKRYFSTNNRIFLEISHFVIWFIQAAFLLKHKYC